MRLVYSAAEYEKHFPRDKLLEKVFGDGNYSAIFSGASGSGKDTACMALLDVDMREGRTPIILDVKMEYPSTIFLQQDTILANLLKRFRKVPKAYKTNLWIPYIKGLERNQHFQELLKHHHPNLQIRPFRILTPNLVSEDTKNFALGKSFLQAMAVDKENLKGQSGMYNKIREEIARVKLCFDDEPLDSQGQGWEYLNFEKMTNSKAVNVISFFFMLGKNNISAISFAISILNELLTIGKGTNRARTQQEVFSIYIPEVQIILPKQVKPLEDVVNVLVFSMLVGLLLMRSFYARLRMNLQNLSALPSDMFSQSRLYAGRTSNPRDFRIFNTFGYGRETRKVFRTLPTGSFIDLLGHKRFGIVPKSHKAKAQESFLSQLQAYRKDPSSFLFETPNCYLTELDSEVLGELPMPPDLYSKKVKAWLKSRRVRMPAELEFPTDEESEPDEQVQQDLGEFEEAVSALG